MKVTNLQICTTVKKLKSRWNQERICWCSRDAIRPNKTSLIKSLIDHKMYVHLSIKQMNFELYVFLKFKISKAWNQWIYSYFKVHKYILRSPQNLKTSLWSPQKTLTLISVHYFIFFLDCYTKSLESFKQFQRLCFNKLWSSSQRKQNIVLPKSQIQSTQDRIQKVSNLPNKSSFGRISFLPRVCLQKRNLWHVWCENSQNQKLQTKLSLIWQ